MSLFTELKESIKKDVLELIDEKDFCYIYIDEIYEKLDAKTVGERRFVDFTLDEMEKEDETIEGYFDEDENYNLRYERRLNERSKR